MAPVVHGLEQEWGEQIRFVYLDIDDPRTDPFKEALGYRVQPHFFLLDAEGRAVEQWLGPVSPEELTSAFLSLTSP
jgi:thiol-disulfide isomerase/thioredoxin